jgi:hypothetical protein
MHNGRIWNSGNCGDGPGLQILRNSEARRRRPTMPNEWFEGPFQVGQISKSPLFFQVPFSVLGVDTDSVFNCGAASVPDPSELLLFSAASSFLSCSIS